MFRPTPLRILLGLVLGAALGYIAQQSASPLLHKVPSLLSPFGTLFINAIRLCVVPLVTSRLILGCAAARSPGRIGRIAARSMVIISGYVVVAALFASAFAFPIFRHLDTLIHGGAHTVSTAAPLASSGGFGQWVSDLIPANLFKSLNDGALLPLIPFSIGFGLAIQLMPEEHADLLRRFFGAVAEAFTILIGAVLRAAPLGVFFLSIGLATNLGVRGIGALLTYIAVLSVINAAYILVVLYPSVAVLAAVPLRVFLRAAAPSQALAFTSRSSLAALPATYAAAREQLGIEEDVASFFFPFAASIFRVGGCMAQVVGASFLAGFYGVPLSSGHLALITLNAVALSFTVPGIPGGAIIVMVPILSALGVPLEGLAMLLAIDTLPDMFRTMANVTGWLAAGTLLPTTGFVSDGKPSAT